MNTILKHYQEFQEVLRGYHPSERARSALAGLNFIVMLAPTSTGRNTVIRHLTKSGDYCYIVSDTTRPPRLNDGVLEQNGREYWFRTEEEMLTDLKNGEFLEAEILHHQQVSGISIRELLKAKEQRKVAITDIDIQGVHSVLKAKPDTIAILLLPPSFEEWQRRIKQRGHMGPEEYSRRLDTALRIFVEGEEKDYYRYVIAENVDQSASIIGSIAKGMPNPHQDRGKELVRRLHDDLDNYLKHKT